MPNPELTADPSICVRDLSYKFPDGSDGLIDMNLDLPAGSRTLLIGGMYALVLVRVVHGALLKNSVISWCDCD